MHFMEVMCGIWSALPAPRSVWWSLRGSWRCDFVVAYPGGTGLQLAAEVHMHRLTLRLVMHGHAAYTLRSHALQGMASGSVVMTWLTARCHTPGCADRVVCPQHCCALVQTDAPAEEGSSASGDGAPQQTSVHFQVGVRCS